MRVEAPAGRVVVKLVRSEPDTTGRMTDSGRIAVGSRVRVTWASPREGYRGTVVKVRNGTLLVRFDGERWRYLPPVPVCIDEVEPDGLKHPASTSR